jgi:hypothetical protein
MVVPRQPVARGFFSGPDYRVEEELTDESRWISAAAYLDPGFAHRVIGEIVDHPRRSVAQSQTVDLVPVVTHSLRARRLALRRDGFLTAVILVGLLLAPVATMAWLAVGLTVLSVRWLRPVRVRSLKRTDGSNRLLITALVASGLAVIVFASWAGSPLLSAALDLAGLGRATDLAALAVGAVSGLAVLLPVGLGGLTWFGLFVTRQQVYSILVNELAPGARPPEVRLGPDQIASRLAFVGPAQRGNLTILHGRAFLGAGAVTRSWSVAVPLVVGGDTVLLDPVEAYRWVRTAVEGMRRDDLPEGARLASVRVLDHVVVDGNELSADAGDRDPLLHESGLPYTFASPSAIDAIARSPQGGLRYYQRILVPSASGKPARWREHVVLPGQKMGIDVSLFVHLAIEGGLLYAELVATVLPPVARRYRLGETLSPDRFRPQAAGHSLLGMPADSAAAPWRFVNNAVRSAVTAVRLGLWSPSTVDYGARLSVRELAAEPVATELARLDELKYVALLERTVREALADFLVAHGIAATGIAVTDVGERRPT